MNKPVDSGQSEVSKEANRAAQKFAKETEHVELNADTSSGEAIIYNIRGMAHAAGFEAGVAWIIAKSEDWWNQLACHKKEKRD